MAAGACIIAPVPKRTCIVLVLLTLTLLAWNPVPRVRFLRRQCVASVAGGMMKISSAGVIVIGRGKSILLHAALENLVFPESFQVLRV